MIGLVCGGCCYFVAGVFGAADVEGHGGDGGHGEGSYLEPEKGTCTFNEVFGKKNTL